MPTPQRIQRTYYLLMLGATLANSAIWGINTIFLLDAGLSNFEAFTANAFFTAGMVIFEVPTGIVADTVGRRFSYLVGTVTLTVATLLYVLLWQVEAGFWWWALVSIMLGLGFTFFSGAVEAWLVDALAATGFDGELEAVLGRGQIATGIAMLAGSIGGGVLASAFSLGVPFLVRAAALMIMFVVAYRLMFDIGFTPEKGQRPLAEMRKIAKAGVDFGWRVPAVKWLMVEVLFTGGVGIYAFYALQPYLLELYGDSEAYSIAGLVAAIVAGAQILGGIAAPRIRRLFRKRTSALIVTAGSSTLVLALIGLIENFYAVLGLIVIWGLLFAATMPIRQAYLNAMIPSKQRATILSFDSLMGSVGGVWAQPGLGKAADAFGYAPSYLISSAVSATRRPVPRALPQGEQPGRRAGRGRNQRGARAGSRPSPRSSARVGASATSRR